MLKRLSIVLGIVVMTMIAAGAWVYANQDKVYGPQSTEVAEVEPKPDLDEPTAERNLGRLGRHFKAAPPPKQEKKGWSLW